MRNGHTIILRCHGSHQIVPWHLISTTLIYSTVWFRIGGHNMNDKACMPNILRVGETINFTLAFFTLFLVTKTYDLDLQIWTCWPWPITSFSNSDIDLWPWYWWPWPLTSFSDSRLINRILMFDLDLWPMILTSISILPGVKVNLVPSCKNQSHSSNGLAVRVLMERQTSTHTHGSDNITSSTSVGGKKKYQTHFPLCIVRLGHHFPHWLRTNIDSPSRQTLLPDTSYLDIQLKLGKNLSVCNYNTLHQKRNSLVVWQAVQPKFLYHLDTDHVWKMHITFE